MGLFVISSAVPRRRNGSTGGSAHRRIAASLALAALTGLLAGCASPGPPLPPSLHLPELAKGLTAERVGERVTLTWTTSANTTDGDRVRGPIVAVLCREIPDAQELARIAQGDEEKRPKAPAVKQNPVKGKKAPPAQAPLPVVADLERTPIVCDPIERFGVAPGLTHAVDILPPTLAAGPATLIGYKVELLSAQQRSAGFSAVAYAAAGSAPESAGELHATNERGGVLLRWTPRPAGAAVEVRRTLLKAAPETAAARTRPASSGPFRAPARKPEAGKPDEARGNKAAEPIVLAAPTPASDPGGMLDATPLDGGTYTYVAQRVQRVTLAGKPLELRGEASAAATVIFRDTFPPAQPVGLEAAIDGGFGRPLSVDLSWEPNTEADLAGYYVLRAAVSDHSAATPGVSPAQMQPMNVKPLTSPAFRDLTVAAGKVYEYRVVAVDTLGNRSTASEPVRQALPQP